MLTNQGGMDREEFGCLRGKAWEEQMKLGWARAHSGLEAVRAARTRNLPLGKLNLNSGWNSSAVCRSDLLGLVSEELCLGTSGRHGQPWAPLAHSESQSLEKCPGRENVWQ